MIGQPLKRLIYTLTVLGASCVGLHAASGGFEGSAPVRSIASEKSERDRNLAESIYAHDVDDVELSVERAAAEKQINDDRQARLRAQAMEQSLNLSELERTESTSDLLDNPTMAIDPVAAAISAVKPLATAPEEAEVPLVAEVPAETNPGISKVLETVQLGRSEDRVVPEVAAENEKGTQRVGTADKPAHLAVQQAVGVAVQEKQHASIASSAGAGAHLFAPAGIDTGREAGRAARDTEVLTVFEVRRILATTKDFAGKNLADLVMESYDFSGANLAGANLQNVDLYHSNFSGANLAGANLKGASLEMVNFSDANLQGAKLSQTSLFLCNMRGANLDGTQIRNSYAAGIKLQDANIRRTDLQGTYTAGASFDEMASDMTTVLQEKTKGARTQSRVPAPPVK